MSQPYTLGPPCAAPQIASAEAGGVRLALELLQTLYLDQFPKSLP